MHIRKCITYGSLARVEKVLLNSGCEYDVIIIGNSQYLYYITYGHVLHGMWITSFTR